MDLKLFITPKDNEVKAELNKDVFSSYSDLSNELHHIIKALKDCPHKCRIIIDVLNKRAKELTSYLNWLEKPKRPTASPITHQRPTKSETTRRN